MTTYRILKEYDETLMLIEDMIGSNGSSNFQLDKLGENIFGPYYLGTYSSDHFPKYIHNEQCFIMNNKSSRTKGEHFIAFYKRNGKLYGYDTFDRKPNTLSPYWKNKHIINANTERSQSYREGNCGPRSLAWLICFSKYGERVIGVI